MKHLILLVFLMSGCSDILAQDNDCLKYETLVKLFWAGDDFAVRDTVLIAMSIKRVDGKYRVLPLEGDAFWCDNWKPINRGVK